MANNEERVATGIQGFDNLCEGGLIRDNIHLVLGNAGSGKTTFCTQFLFNGVTKYSENGLFISFEQNINDLMRTSEKFGMNFKDLEKQNKCFFIKIDPTMTLKDLQKELIKKVTKYDIKRIVFDPINVFVLELPKEVSLRRQLYSFFDLLRQLNVCVLVSGESDGEKGDVPIISEEIFFSKYLSDSIIELYSSGIGGAGDRAIRIQKMRTTNNFRGPVGMTITNKGIKITKE
jgi:circadian clock protein KaiC